MTSRTRTGHPAAHAARVKPVHPHAVATLDADEIDEPVAADIEPEVRYRMISEAAYHRFLERGCEDGFEVDDWLAAEGDVARQLTRAAGLGVPGGSA